MPRFRLIVALIATPTVFAVLTVAVSAILTERTIAGHEAAVQRISLAQTPLQVDPRALEGLPAPVQKYLKFALPAPNTSFRLVRLEAEGQFRRPLTTGFMPTTASQTIAVSTPALLFAATTPVGPLWARAYDFFAEGKMEMRARIASTFNVVDEGTSEALNRTSLRRWLLESPLYPMALLPGGPVRWEAIDTHHARATVSGFGLEASLIASFRDDGSLEGFDAEYDGDLTTPYHGSGEHAGRSDYRLVQGMMIPHAFEIARAAGGKLYPFWKGRITAIRYR